MSNIRLKLPRDEVEVNFITVRTKDGEWPCVRVGFLDKAEPYVATREIARAEAEEIIAWLRQFYPTERPPEECDGCSGTDFVRGYQCQDCSYFHETEDA